MRFVALGGLAAACVLLSACATITRGTNQDFMVESTPSQADVKLSTGQTCVTPCTLRLKRKSQFKVTISKDGYQTQEADVHGVVKGGGAAGMAGNVIFGGLIGAGVDASNGSMMNLKPNPLQVTLVPAGAAAPAPAAVTLPAEAAAPAAAPVDTAAPAETPTPTSGNQ
jgi:hypothetical protein